MKYIYLLLIIALINSSCKSKKVKETTDKKQQKTLVKKAPFVVQKSVYYNWFGGMEGIHGITFEINGMDVDKNITFDKLYYQDKEAVLKFVFRKNMIFLKANIDTSTRKDKKFNGDSKKEYGNLPPLKSKFKNLKIDEAVISYQLNGEQNTYKIKLTKIEDLFLP